MSVQPGSSNAAPAGRSGPGHGIARIVRGFFVAHVCLALSAAGHAAAGGPVHLTGQTVVGWLALSVVCVAAAQRRRSFAGIGTVVMLSQVALHVMMTLPSSHMDHGMHGGDMALMPSPMMIGGHIVATALASALLAYGEQLIWALWSWAGLPRVPSTRLVPADAQLAVVPTADRAPADGRIPAGGATRRGPPAA